MIVRAFSLMVGLAFSTPVVAAWNLSSSVTDAAAATLVNGSGTSLGGNAAGPNDSAVAPPVAAGVITLDESTSVESQPQTSLSKAALTTLSFAQATNSPEMSAEFSGSAAWQPVSGEAFALMGAFEADGFDPSFDVTPVPEPSTWIAGGLAAVAFVTQLLRHRRRRGHVCTV